MAAYAVTVLSMGFVSGGVEGGGQFRLNHYKNIVIIAITISPMCMVFLTPLFMEPASVTKANFSIHH